MNKKRSLRVVCEFGGVVKIFFNLRLVISYDILRTFLLSCILSTDCNMHLVVVDVLFYQTYELPYIHIV